MIDYNQELKRCTSETIRTEVTEGIIWGLERALRLVEQSDGDIDFAVFAIKRDIESLKKDAGREEDDANTPNRQNI